jgi:hypothetical protein
MCLKCRSLKPLAQFGLRKMADGAIRNQPWCRTCRSGAGTRKPKDKVTDTLEAMTGVPSVLAPNLLVVPAPAASAEEDEAPIAVASQG